MQEWLHRLQTAVGSPEAVSGEGVRSQVCTRLAKISLVSDLLIVWLSCVVGIL